MSDPHRGGSAPGLPTRGPHVFVASGAIDGGRATIEGDDAHHLAAVLRLRKGDPVSVADGVGMVWQAEVTDVGHAGLSLVLTEQYELAEPRPGLVVVHALPKGRKLDEVVQRLTEIGAARIVPAHSERSEVRLDDAKAAKALRRWRAVALAAAKQSRRARLPEIAAITPWNDAFAGAPSGAVLWEEATTSLSTAVDADGDAAEFVLAVGPEGGLTAAEVAASGLEPAALGATILRTETAALVAASVVLHRLGRLG